MKIQLLSALLLAGAVFDGCLTNAATLDFDIIVEGPIDQLFTAIDNNNLARVDQLVTDEKIDVNTVHNGTYPFKRALEVYDRQALETPEILIYLAIRGAKIDEFDLGDVISAEENPLASQLITELQQAQQKNSPPSKVNAFINIIEDKGWLLTHYNKEILRDALYTNSLEADWEIIDEEPDEEEIINLQEEPESESEFEEISLDDEEPESQAPSKKRKWRFWPF